MADKKISALTAATTPLAGTEVLPIVQSGATVKVAVSDLTAGRAVAVKSVTGDALTDATVANWNSNNGTYGLDIGYLYSSSRIGSMGSAKGIDGTRALTDFGLHGITNLEFFTGYAYRGRFDSSGNFSVNNGNLVIGTSGKGIDFSATSGSGTSELLADYEEGTWSPVYETTGGSFTYSIQTGTYTKIGNVVYCSFRISTATVTAGTGNVLLAGLPFTQNSSSNVRGSFGIGDSRGFSGDMPTGIVTEETGTTTAKLTYRTAANGGVTNLDASDLAPTGAFANIIAGSFFYTA